MARCRCLRFAFAPLFHDATPMLLMLDATLFSSCRRFDDTDTYADTAMRHYAAMPTLIITLP